MHPAHPLANSVLGSCRPELCKRRSRGRKRLWTQWLCVIPARPTCCHAQNNFREPVRTVLAPSDTSTYLVLSYAACYALQNSKTIYLPLFPVHTCVPRRSHTQDRPACAASWTFCLFCARPERAPSSRRLPGARSPTTRKGS